MSVTRRATRSPRSRASAARGFTLLEVLVALVVLSIGLLGIGKLVLFSSRGNDSAYMRSQATAYANSILDSMRSNASSAEAGDYNVGTGAYTYGGPDCTTSTCNAATLAQYDLSQWKAGLAAALPGGDGTVTTATSTDPTTGIPVTTATITVQWNDAVAQQTFGSTAATMTVTLETIL